MMNSQTNDLQLLLPLIKAAEGCKLTAYQCPAGVWTIGWGQTGEDICKGLVWTQSYADERLKTEAIATIEQVLEASPSLAQESSGRVAALADFVYNLGISQYRSSTLKKRVDAQAWTEVPKELLRWNRCKGKVLPGLTKRRQAECALIG